MAKVVGPFLALDASGTFGGIITASIWKGRNYVRQHVVPANPNTAAQIVQRDKMAAAVLAWQGTYSGTQAEWNTAAQDVYPPISGFNYYVSQHILQAGVPTIPAVAPRKSKQIHGN